MNQHDRATTNRPRGLADLGPARDAALRGLVHHVNRFHRGVATPQRLTPSAARINATTQANEPV